LRFATRFSADAFCHWLSEDDELSSSLAIIANSSKILLNQDSEPFIPMPTDDDEGAENLSEPQMDEEGKQRAIERLYHYYNYLILEQNRDRLYARPEEYQNLNRAIRESKESEGELSKNLLLQMDPDDEFASFALGYRSKPSEDSSKFHPEIQVRYSNDQMLRIYKNLGKFEHPLSQLSVYGISSRDFHKIETMSLLTAEKADIMTEFLKEDID
jgi:hypothetical protein